MNIRVLTGIWVSIIFLSCTSKDKLGMYEFYKVHKKDFVNNILVSGVLESANSINKTCPVQGQDLRVIYLIPEGSLVNKGDTICKLECSELKNRFNDALKNFELAKSDYDKNKAQTELEIKILESQIAAIDASTQISMLDSSRLDFYTPTRRKISELNLQKAQIQRDKYIKKLEFSKKINVSLLNKLKLKIKQQENRMKRNKEQLDKLIMLADTSGIIEYAINRFTRKKILIGDVIWGRISILKITDPSSLQVRMLVPETQYKLIQPKFKVDFQIGALDTIIYTGKVKMKIPTGIKIGESEGKIKYFEVISSIEKIPITTHPGIGVNCSVYLHHFKDTICIPIMSVFDYDSSKIVYLKNNKKVKRQVVRTGPNSDKEIVISSGLKPKDIIMLNEPPENLIE